jgi:excisionase family DNA binding protein
MDSEILLTVDDVAELTQLARGTIYHLVSQQRIPFIRLSARCLRFRSSDIQQWISEKLVTPASAS